MRIGGISLVDVRGRREALHNRISSRGRILCSSRRSSMMVALAHFGQIPPMGIHILALRRGRSLVHHPFQSWSIARSCLRSRPSRSRKTTLTTHTTQHPRFRSCSCFIGPFLSRQEASFSLPTLYFTAPLDFAFWNKPKYISVNY